LLGLAASWFSCVAWSSFLRCLVWRGFLHCLLWLPALLGLASCVARAANLALPGVASCIAWSGFRVAWSGFLRGPVWLLALPGLASCIAWSGFPLCLVWLAVLLGLTSCLAWFSFVRSLCFGIRTQSIAWKEIISSAKEMDFLGLY
jgi:hypothetical protein